MSSSQRRTHEAHVECFGGEAARCDAWILWHVKGALADEWSQPGGLCDQIQHVLTKQHLSQNLQTSQSDSERPTFALRCYLVGKDKRHATPYAAIVCHSQLVRNTAKQLICDSKILQKPGFGFLRIDAHMTPSAIANEDDATAVGDSTKGLLEVEESMGASYDGVFVTQLEDKSSWKSVGLSIAVQSESHCQAATLGGVLKVDDAIFAVTIAQAFRNGGTDEAYNSSLLIHQDDLLQSLEGVSESFTGKMTPPSENHHQRCESRLAPESETAFSWDAPVIGKTGQVSLLSRPELGYALVKMKNPTTCFLSNSFAIQDSEGVKVKTATAWAKSLPTSGSTVVIVAGDRGHYSTTSVETTSALHTCGEEASKVWTLALSETTLPQNMLGAWAFTWPEGKWLGMVMGSCAALNEAYLTPAAQIISDLESYPGVKSVMLPQHQVSLLQQAVGSGDIDIVHRILQKEESSHVWMFATRTISPLLAAVLEKDKAKAKRLLDLGADIDKGLYVECHNSLQHACASQQMGLLPLLLGHGANPTARHVTISATPLGCALEDEMDDIAEFLLDHGARLDDVYASRNHPLLDNVSDGDRDVFFEIIGSDAAKLFFADDFKRLMTDSIKTAEQMVARRSGELISRLVDERRRSAQPEGRDELV